MKMVLFDSHNAEQVIQHVTNDYVFKNSMPNVQYLYLQTLNCTNAHAPLNFAENKYQATWQSVPPQWKFTVNLQRARTVHVFQ